MRFAKLCVTLAALALVVSVGAYLATAAAIAAMGPDPAATGVELVDETSEPGVRSWRTDTDIGEGLSVGVALADDFTRAWYDMSGISGGPLVGVAAGLVVVLVAVVGTGRYVRRRVGQATPA